MFLIIAAIGKNRELGSGNQLLWHIPEDLQFFKKTTMGHPILMGHRTFDSLPGLLPGRKHYVVTRNKELFTSPASSRSGQGADGCGHPTPTARGATASPIAAKAAPESDSEDVKSSTRANNFVRPVAGGSRDGGAEPREDGREDSAEHKTFAEVELVNNLSKFAKEHENDDEEIFVIGGGMVYWEMLKYAKVLYLTEVDADFDNADTYFPEFDKKQFKREVLGKGSHDGLDYVFAKYTRK